MKEKFQQFMSGRYGSDRLNRAMLIVSIVLILIHMFASWSVLYILASALLIFAIYRTFSRDTVKRSEENNAFEKFWGKFRNRFSSAEKRVKQRKTHKFYKCPFCSQELRVPRGRGRISITCPKCRNSFIKNT